MIPWIAPTGHPVCTGPRPQAPWTPSSRRSARRPDHRSWWRGSPPPPRRPRPSCRTLPILPGGGPCRSAPGRRCGGTCALRLGEEADKAARLLLPLAYAQGSGPALGRHLASPGRCIVARPRIRQRRSDLAAQDRRLLCRRRPCRRPLGLPAVPPGTRRVTSWTPRPARRPAGHHQTLDQPCPPRLNATPGLGRRPSLHPHPPGHPRRTSRSASTTCSPTPHTCSPPASPQLLAAGAARSAPARGRSRRLPPRRHHLRTAPAPRARLLPAARRPLRTGTRASRRPRKLPPARHMVIQMGILAARNPSPRPYRPHRRGVRGGGRGAGRPPGGDLRQRGPDGAGMGPGYRRAGRRPVHRPHRRGERGGGHGAGRPARWSSPAATTARCGCGTWLPARPVGDPFTGHTGWVMRGGGRGAGRPPGGRLRQR